MMKVFKERSFTKFLAQIIFLLLPTILVVAFVLYSSNQYFSFLREQWKEQTIYFALGMLIAFIISQVKFRFIPLFGLLLFLFYSIYQLLDNYSTGEFDSFFISVQFMVFAWLFATGWLVGWSMQRVKYAPIILAGLLFVLSIFLISKTGHITVESLLVSFTPIALYGVYLVYTSEALRNVEKINLRFWLLFSARLMAFCIFILALFGIVIYVMYPQIKERVEEYGGQGKDGENQMLQNKKDGTVENRDKMGLSGNNKRNNNPEPLFCAHIESTLSGTDIPNPLYLTSYHFTKFDTLTETFERDTLFKFNDEFIPDPSKIPLFFTFKDSSRLDREMAWKSKTTVEVEVYKKKLSEQFFVAPSTGYFVQPITVEKDFQNEFTSAYRSKSYVSELNSAYFIYNSEDPQLRAFQEQRFEVLRKAKSFTAMNQEMFSYYTFFPTNGQYRPVKQLADSLSKGKLTAMDKILAVRDYFLAKDETGKQTYQYADNPGIPGLPGASKLLYFLFESKKGYCAYYAAATVALLRSMKIPCRVVTGFLTVDRSDKNKGWYWFYEDQSHGWVQVYFPEYGWIDFDTTVGNEEAEQSPTPDGTPPMEPPRPVLALAAKIISTDTIKKEAEVLVSNLLFKDQEFPNLKVTMELDLRIARIWKDSIQMPLNILKKGDDIMAVSFAEKLKNLSAEKEFERLLSKLPKSIPTDEVYIKDLSKNQQETKTQSQEVSNSIFYYLARIILGLICLIALVLSIPYIVYLWYKFKMNHSDKIASKAYYTYMTSSLYLHMIGERRNSETPLKYALYNIDPSYQTQYAAFLVLYLKQKYANQVLSSTEEKFISEFYPTFIAKIKSKISLWKRTIRFCNINNFINYYLNSDALEQENLLTP